MATIDLLAKRARQVAAGQFADIPSPCVSVCRMDPATEWCEGCFRTLDEIALWGRMGEADRKSVWQSIASRIARRAASSAAPRHK